MKVLIQEAKVVHDVCLNIYLPFEFEVLPIMEAVMKGAGFDVKNAYYELMPNGVYWEIKNKEKGDHGLAVIGNHPFIHLGLNLKSKDKEYIIKEFKKSFEVIIMSEQALDMEEIWKKAKELFVKKLER